MSYPFRTAYDEPPVYLSEKEKHLLEKQNEYDADREQFKIEMEEHNGKCTYSDI